MSIPEAPTILVGLIEKNMQLESVEKIEMCFVGLCSSVSMHSRMHIIQMDILFEYLVHNELIFRTSEH